MNSDLVSVIIPAYKAEQYIEETITSVLRQTHSNIEIIVVDDGSPDNQQEVLLPLVNSDHRISYLTKENGGVSKARNFGLERASGKYIAFLDSDDLWDDAFIEVRVKLLEEDLSLVGVGSDIQLIDEDSKLLNQQFKALTTKEELLNFDEGTQSCPSSYIYRKEVLDSNNVEYHPNLFNTADRFFLHEILQYGNIGYVKGGDMYYRILSQSMSRKVSTKLLRDYDIYLSDLEERGLIPQTHLKKYKSRFLYTSGAYAYYLGKHMHSLKYLVQAFYQSPNTCLKLLNQRSRS